MEQSKGCLIWLALIIAASLTYNWINSQGGLWTASVFPTARPVMPERIGDFETFEACRVAAEADLIRRDAGAVGSFECARKCERRRNGDYRCVEIRP